MLILTRPKSRILADKSSVREWRTEDSGPTAMGKAVAERLPRIDGDEAGTSGNVEPLAVDVPDGIPAVALNVLEMLEGANLLVDEQGTIRWHGRRAALLLARAELIVGAPEGALVFLESGNDRQFRRSLAELVSSRSETCRYFHIAGPGRNGETTQLGTASLFSVPTARAASPRARLVLVCVRLWLEPMGAGDCQALRRMFGLTRAEASVVGYLAQGSAIKDVATIRGRRLSTIRNQQHSAYAKLGVASQAELMAVIGRLSPQVVAGGGWGESELR